LKCHAESHPASTLSVLLRLGHAWVSPDLLERYRFRLSRDSASHFLLEHDLLTKTGSHFSKIMLDAADG
jgi:hypothetical protein